MLFVLCGTDRLAVRERRDALLAEYLPEGSTDMALSRLDGQKCSADDLSRAVQALPFFGDRRVVLVDDLLTRFEPKRKRGIPAETADAATPADEPGEDTPPALVPAGKSERPFVAALSNIAPSTILILWERGSVAKANPLLKVAAKLGTVEAHEAPKAAEIEDWLFARARKKGARLKPEVPRLLAEHLGADLEVLDSELDKLILYAGEGVMVDTAMVRMLTPETQQADTLQLLNAASDHQTARALGLLHELLDHGVAPVALIGMLGSQVRKLLQVQALAARHLGQADIAARLAMHPYAVRMTIESLRHHTPAGLHDLHTRLLQTDLAIKTGQADGEAALELLVLDLTRRR